jgi:hypothetical protein
MIRGSAQPDRTTGPSRTNVIAHGNEAMEPIKANRRKTMNNFGLRENTEEPSGRRVHFSGLKVLHLDRRT